MDDEHEYSLQPLAEGDEVVLPVRLLENLCPKCRARMSEGTFICIMCGFNRRTGEFLKTTVERRTERPLQVPLLIKIYGWILMVTFCVIGFGNLVGALIMTPGLIAQAGPGALCFWVIIGMQCWLHFMGYKWGEEMTEGSKLAVYGFGVFAALMIAMAFGGCIAVVANEKPALHALAVAAIGVPFVPYYFGLYGYWRSNRPTAQDRTSQGWYNRFDQVFTFFRWLMVAVVAIVYPLLAYHKYANRPRGDGLMDMRIFFIVTSCAFAILGFLAAITMLQLLFAPGHWLVRSDRGAAWMERAGVASVGLFRFYSFVIVTIGSGLFALSINLLLEGAFKDTPKGIQWPTLQQSATTEPAHITTKDHEPGQESSENSEPGAKPDEEESTAESKPNGSNSDDTDGLKTKRSKEQDSAFRLWTDATGRRQVEAKLISASDDEVTLERRSGKQVTIPITALSEADQQWLLSQANDL